MPWNLPFQPDAGIHTSNWIFESAAGLMTPATRQNAGTLLSAPPSGGVKSPATTDAAVLIVVLARASVDKPSQLAAAAGRQTAARDANRAMGRSFISISLCLFDDFL